MTQLRLVEEACEALGLPWSFSSPLSYLGLRVLKKEGYEADDIIATYTRLAQENGHRVTIISPDKVAASIPELMFPLPLTC